MYQRVISVVQTVDTNAYASGDQLGIIKAIPNAINLEGGSGKLLSLVVQDKADQTAIQMEVLFWSRSVTLAADNAAVSISDTDSNYFLGRVSIVTADWEDIGGAKVATKTGIHLPLQSSVPGSKDIYFSLISKGTPTFGAATDLVLKFGIEYP